MGETNDRVYFQFSQGANPADYYGEGYTSNDFTRLNMYRDIGVYEEIGRRAKIVCNDLNASVGGGLLSVNQWAAAASATRRFRNRRLQGELDHLDEAAVIEEHKRHLKEAIPDLSGAQLHDYVMSEESRNKEDAAIRACAPEYSTSCVFGALGPDKDTSF